MQENKKKLGIVTINFYTEDLLERLILSLLDQTYKNWVLVIVNNSPDDSMIKEIIYRYKQDNIFLLSINKNVGYSKGNNAGFNYLMENNYISIDDLVLFTNEDIVIKQDDFLDNAVGSIAGLNAGFWGPKIINTDGSFMLPHLKPSNYLKCLLHLGNNGLADKLFNINKTVKNINHALEVFLLNGAFFICRVSDFTDAGKFNENTFMYYEEELLFREVAKKKIKVIYDPTINIYHEHSASIKKSFSILRKKKFVYEGELYFLKNILKINKFLECIFKIERNLEFLGYKISGLIKR